MIEEDLAKRIQDIPVGYSEVLYKDRKYGLTREDYASDRSIKVFAKELGGEDFISFNYYKTEAGKVHFKPCEMSAQKVTEFLEGYSPV